MSLESIELQKQTAANNRESLAAISDSDLSRALFDAIATDESSSV